MNETDHNNLRCIMEHGPESVPDDVIHHVAGAAVDEIARLRAIMDKVPKTRDGVPIYPQMQAWVLAKNESGERTIATPYKVILIGGSICRGSLGGYRTMHYVSVRLVHIWSTRKSAERAARENTP